MRRGKVAVCVVALIAAVAAPSVAARPVIKNRRAVTTRESALVIAINSVRRLHLLPRLRIDRRLVRAARSHSRDMLRRQYFAHGNFGRRMVTFHIRGSRLAENLVWGSGIMSANSAVAEWLASPPHRANLLDPSLRRIGIGAPVGVFEGYAPATMITADFAGN
jgi:uncharacterized protein YkwD